MVPFYVSWKHQKIYGSKPISFDKKGHFETKASEEQIQATNKKIMTEIRTIPSKHVLKLISSFAELTPFQTTFRWSHYPNNFFNIFKMLTHLIPIYYISSMFLYPLKTSEKKTGHSVCKKTTCLQITYWNR